jgi:hypothetical protein
MKHPLTLFLTSSLIFTLTLFITPWGRPLLFEVEEGTSKVKDFIMVFSTVVAYWWHGAPGIASREAITLAFERVVGMEVRTGATVMPNAFSPTVLLIWAPLLIPFRISMGLAFSTWLGISLGAILTLLQRIWIQIRSAGPLARDCLIFGTFGTIFSHAGLTCLHLGQASIVALAVTGWLLQRLIRGKTNKIDPLIDGVLLFFLSLKLPYFAIGAALLFMERQWQALAIGAMLSVGGAILVDPFGHNRVVLDFIATLRRYSSGQIGSGGFFWDGFGSDTPTWLTISADYFDDKVRFLINSGAVGLGGLLYTLLFWRAPQIAPRARLVATAALVCGDYLCFSPYVGFYDQILIALPLSGAIHSEIRYSRWMPFAVFGILEVALSQLEPMVIGFVMKVGVLGCLGVWAMIASERRNCKKAYSLSSGSTNSR